MKFLIFVRGPFNSIKDNFTFSNGNNLQAAQLNLMLREEFS